MFGLFKKDNQKSGIVYSHSASMPIKQVEKKQIEKRIVTTPYEWLWLTDEEKENCIYEEGDWYDMSFDDFCSALSLNQNQKDELYLLYKFADDENLLIVDFNDLRTLCTYISENISDYASYCFSVPTLQSIIRKINIEESKGSFQKYNQKNKNSIDNSKNESLNIKTGEDFEKYCLNLLKENGFYNLALTSATGDYGVDILAEKDDISYAIQCKYYSSPVGNTAIQEVYSGKQYYKKDIAVVMTNSTFTRQAYECANNIGVKLWDGEVIEKRFKSQASINVVSR